MLVDFAAVFVNVKIFATKVEAVKFRNEVVPKRPSDGAVLGTWKHRDGQCQVVQMIVPGYSIDAGLSWFF